MIRRSFGIVLAVVAAMLVTVASPAVAAAPELAVSQSAVAPDLQVPHEWLAAALRCTDGDPGAEPVLLVPGTALDAERDYPRYTGALAGRGRPHCAVELPADGLEDVQVSAEHVVAALRTMHARWGSPVDVLGHEAGAVQARWALRFWPDTRALVDDLVALAPPHRGSAEAGAACAEPCAPAFQQLRPGSTLLAVLADGPGGYAGVDHTVVHSAGSAPAGDLPAAGVANVAVQDVCPDHAAGPVQLGTTDAVAAALALDALDADGPADPARVDPAVCRAPLREQRAAAREDAAVAAARSAAIAAGPRTAVEPALAEHARS
jgi:hypothetical protein